jgi:hypothetical protein
VRSCTSLNGSSNWIVLTPSQTPPATERAVLVDAPVWRMSDALATLVQAAMAAVTAFWVATAPSPESAFATR